MRLTLHVDGVIPADKRYNEMKAIWEMCERANINPPFEVMEFFNGEKPDSKGVVMEIKELPAVSKWYQEDYGQGFEIDIRELPEPIKIIRFYASS